MKPIHILSFILSTIMFVVSLVRICMGIGQASDMLQYCGCFVRLKVKQIKVYDVGII